MYKTISHDVLGLASAIFFFKKKVPELHKEKTLKLV